MSTLSVALLKHAMTNTPHIIMLIGPPASGKSTWIQNNKQDHVIISTDDIIEMWGSELGLTYSEVWKTMFKDAERKMKEDYHQALMDNRNIIIDRTNMSKKIRSKLLFSVPENYWKYGIIFSASREELDRRLLQRPGKHIPAFVMDDMLERYEEPTLEEFDAIFV